MGNWIIVNEKLPDVNFIKVLTTENTTVAGGIINNFRTVNLRVFIKNNDKKILKDNEWDGIGFYDYTDGIWRKVKSVIAWQCVESPYLDDLNDEYTKRKVIE